MTNDRQPRERVHLLGSLLRLISMLVNVSFGVWGALALLHQFPAALWLRAIAAALWVVLSLVALIFFVISFSASLLIRQLELSGKHR